jgi:hypothetical protein
VDKCQITAELQKVSPNKNQWKINTALSFGLMDSKYRVRLRDLYR